MNRRFATVALALLALVAPRARAELRISVFSSTIENAVKVHGVTYAGAAKMLREAGVSGFDCDYRDARISEYIAAGLQPVNLYGGVDFLGPDGGKTNAEAFVAAAARYRVPRIMVIPIESESGEYAAADLDRIVAGLRGLVALAGAKGITVTIEDYGGERNVCSHLKYMKEMLERVPDLRYALDSGNFAHAGRGEDILEMLCFSNRIAHVHLKDSPPGDGRKRVSVGTGAVPNAEIVRTVAAQGYDGWYTLENLVGEDRLPDVRRQIARIRRWVTEGWASAGGRLAGGEPVTFPHTRNPPAFPRIGKARALTHGPKDHFLASYFAINSWSPDLRYVLALETDVNGRLSKAGEPCTIGVIDTKDGDRFIPVAETRAWNFQEAAMGHWLPWAKDTILFNDFRDGRFVTVIMNWRTKEERIIPYPVSAVSPDGTKAISLNYARIRLTRPDYGYAGPGQDPLVGEAWPEKDGLWLVDLRTGEAKLIVPVSAVRGQAPEVKPEGLFYFCHTVFSRDGKRVFWLARGIDWYDPVKEKAGPWSTTAFTCEADGSNIRRCFPGRDWGGSHFNWLDGETMVVTVYPKEIGHGGWHVKFTVGKEEEVKRLAPGLLDWDGHCVWSPDGQWMSTEGYFDKTYQRNWVLMRSEDEAVIPVGSFFVPEAYRGGFWRCDLHARWRPDGKQLGFNSVHEGSRQIYVIDLE